MWLVALCSCISSSSLLRKHQDWRWQLVPLPARAEHDAVELLPVAWGRTRPWDGRDIWKNKALLHSSLGNNLNNGMDHEKYGWHGMLPSYQEIKGYDQSIFSLSVHIFNNTIQTESNGLVGRFVVPIFQHHFAIHHFLSFSHLIFTHHFTYHTSSPLPTSFQTSFRQIKNTSVQPYFTSHFTH